MEGGRERDRQARFPSFLPTSLFGHFLSKKKEERAVAVIAHGPLAFPSSSAAAAEADAAGRQGAPFPNGEAPRERPLGRQRKREKDEDRRPERRTDGRTERRTDHIASPSPSSRRVLWLLKRDREWERSEGR